MFLGAGVMSCLWLGDYQCVNVIGSSPLECNRVKNTLKVTTCEILIQIFSRKFRDKIKM